MRLMNLVLPPPPSSPRAYRRIGTSTESREDDTRRNHLYSGGPSHCLPQMEPPLQVPTLAGGDRCGARAAKKIAIAGAAIIAAPVVLPALLILFALGVALALPSALFLASFACADKLMSSLLGLPEELDAGNGDADGETVVDEGRGDGVEIPVDAESPDSGHSSSASEVERPPPREVSQESRDIEVEETTKERDESSKQEEEA